MKAQFHKKFMGIRMIYPLAALILLILAALSYMFFFAAKPLSLPAGDDIRVKLSSMPGVYHVGDIIPVTLEVQARPGVSFVMPNISDIHFGSLEMVQKGNLITEKPRGGSRRTITYQLTCWDAGKHSVGGFKLPYRSAAGVQKVYTVPSCIITIKSLLPAGKSMKELAALPVKDVKKPVALPPRYFILWWFLGIVALCVLGYFAVKYLRRYLSKKAPAIETGIDIATIREPAHVIALRRLEALQKKNYVEQGIFKPYYTELAECTREYLENRFQIRALEMTTEEFLEGFINDRTLGLTHQQILTEFLRSADLVKFAKCLPLSAEAEKSLALVKQFIAETKAEPVIANQNDSQVFNLPDQEHEK
jgi:hypothetical protein